jgi:Tfp pilus assembly ATPase PilU
MNNFTQVHRMILSEMSAEFQQELVFIDYAVSAKSGSTFRVKELYSSQQMDFVLI